MKITEKDLEDMISGLKCMLSSSKYAYETCGFVDHKGNPLCPDPESTRYLHEEGVSEANRIIQLLDSLISSFPLQGSDIIILASGLVYTKYRKIYHHQC